MVLRISCAIAILLAASCSLAQSQQSSEYDRFNHPVRIHLGGFYPTMSSEITINGDIVRPPPIDIEKVLGVEEGKFVGWGGVQWHISRRNSIELEYFKLARDGFINLIPDPISIGDLIIESGSINTALDISIGRLTYGFSLKRSERSDLQIKAGLHIADMSAGLQLNGAVCDVSLGQMPPGCPAGQSPPAESGEVTAPLPHFGLSWAYAFSPTIAAEVRAIGFAIELDGIDGGLYEISGDLSWQPWQNFGFSFGLRYFDVNVKAGESDLNGEFDLEYYGPALSVFATF